MNARVRVASHEPHKLAPHPTSKFPPRQLFCSAEYEKQHVTPKVKRIDRQRKPRKRSKGRGGQLVDNKFPSWTYGGQQWTAVDSSGQWWTANRAWSHERSRAARRTKTIPSNMARLSHDMLSPSPAARGVDPMTDLNRILSRLQQTVLRADAERERRLRTSEYERNKVGVNIDYARTLLTRMERDALTVKVLSRRQDLQGDLNRKRELLEQLTDRMKDLEQMGAEDEDDSSEGEDILADIIATPSESMDSRSTDLPGIDTEAEEEEEISSTPAIRRQSTTPAQEKDDVEGIRTKGEGSLETPEAITSQTIRSRGKQPERNPEKEGGTAQATGAAAALFGNRIQTGLSVATTTEAILDHQREEQDELSESILKMAEDLKQSSLQFAEALEEDTEILSKAGEGLDKNERGLEAAARRMSTLTRMTEGKGWWGRVMLYAWVYGLMLFLVVLVFALPKLRF